MPAGEVAASAQQEGLLYSPLEPVVPLLDVPVLVRRGGLRTESLQPVMPHERLITAREDLRMRGFVDGRRQPIRLMHRRYTSELPQRIL